MVIPIIPDPLNWNNWNDVRHDFYLGDDGDLLNLDEARKKERITY